MWHTPALYALADGIFLDSEPARGFLYGHPVLGCVLGCVPFLSHEGHARPLGAGPKALRSHPRGSQQGQISVRIQRFILRLAGYKILVGTGPSSRRKRPMDRVA